MAITSQTQYGIGATIVEVESDLTGVVYFHWYVDGQHVGATTVGRREFTVEPQDEVVIDVLDTNDPDFDFVVNAPTQYPARWTLWWIQASDSDVDHYWILMTIGIEATEIGRIPHDPNVWTYEVRTPRLPDLATCRFFLTAYDAAGNSGTSVELHPPGQKVVRTPDSPAFTVSFDEGSARITVEAA